MNEVPVPRNEEIIKGSRKIVIKDKYTTIWDPRIENYDGTNPLFHELSPKCVDQGPKWVIIPNDLLDEVEAILNKYPESPETEEAE